MDSHNVKVLGLLWNRVDDMIHVPGIDEALKGVVTK